MGATGNLVRKGLALSYLLLCRASEIWAHENELVHSEFCLTKGDITFERVNYAFRDKPTEGGQSGGIFLSVESRSEENWSDDHKD